MHWYEWAFSGIGVLGVGGVVRWLYMRLHRRGPSQRVGAISAGDTAWVEPVPIHISETVRSESAPAPVILRASITPVTVLQKHTTAALNHWLYETVRISAGDYYSCKAGPSTIRVEVSDIRTAAIPQKFGGVKDAPAVELYVNLGGAVVYGGAGTVEVSVNRYLVPREAYEESRDAIYAFNTSDNYFSFLRISVMHINSHDRCADVSIVALSIDLK